MTNLQDITAVIGGKLYSGKLRADGKYKLTPLRPEPSRGDSLTSLAEILDHINYQDGGVKAAQAAIAELVEGALPEKYTGSLVEGYGIEENIGWNAAIDEIRNNLKAKGII